MGMRGIHTSINDIRKQVFAEVAKLSYEYNGSLADMENIPYRIIPGEVSTYRESVFLERAMSTGYFPSPISPHLEISSKFPSKFFPKPIPGSRMILSLAIPAFSAKPALSKR